MSKLYFRYGAMNSGKSTAILQVAHNYEERGMKILLVKSTIDTKAEDKVSSRIGAERKVDFLLPVNSSLFKFLDKKNLPAAILVDEAQFLTPTQVDELYFITKNFNIPVICYGLRCDFKMNGFEGATRLLQIADDIEELKTICRCGKKATQNVRFINGQPIFEGEQIEIDDGSKVQYESVCGDCYLKLKNLKQQTQYNLDVKITDFNVNWHKIKSACMTTISKEAGSKEPSDEWKRKLLICQHSPIRRGEVSWKWPETPYAISTHFVRHHEGCEKFIGTERTDRTGINREERSQMNPVPMEMDANIQALINISMKRLCTCADPLTTKYWQAVLDAIYEYDENIFWANVPQCVRSGGCVEPFSNCQFYKKLMEGHTLEEQSDVMKRYDIYNEYAVKQLIRRKEKKSQNKQI